MNVQALDEFKKLFEGQYGKPVVSQGQVVEGKVVAVLRDYAIVNIGFKSEGYISIEEFRNLDGQITVQAGDPVKVVIEELEDDKGNIILSKEKADAVEAWSRVEQIYNENGNIDGLVVNKVKGGLSINLGGIKAFLPEQTRGSGQQFLAPVAIVAFIHTFARAPAWTLWPGRYHAVFRRGRGRYLLLHGPNIPNRGRL